MLRNLTQALRRLPQEAADAIVEINTSGGSAEAGRSIALELGLFQSHGRTVYAVGKTTVYSAGVTVLSVVPCCNRFLTENTMLLVHERRQTKQLELSGPIQACLQKAQEEVSSLEESLELERRGFAKLVEGSNIDVQHLTDFAQNNWYISAQKALEFGLIARILV